MQTLYHICINKIIDLKLNIYYLPDFIQNDIRYQQILNICGTSVSRFKNCLFSYSKLKCVIQHKISDYKYKSNPNVKIYYFYFMGNLSK